MAVHDLWVRVVCGKSLAGSHLSRSCRANGLDGELRRCDGRTEGFNRTGLTNTAYGPYTDSVQNRIPMDK